MAMDISQKCKGHFNLITFIVVVGTITVTWNLSMTNMYLRESSKLATSQILNTSNINYIDPSNCFISDMNQSVEGIIYSAQQHGALMNTLMDEYIITNKLKIFTMHYMRYPTLYEYKCKIPMTSLHVSESNYFIDSQFYHRNHNRNNVNKTIDCIYLGHGNTGTLLRISFIPKIVQYILDGYIKRST
eukprot:443305_1